ncbi:serine hydrolase domain-containing protein [Nocardia rhizosphaerihabitans]|uniref:serine hydrolase domain-containing protein n=1 Tax=Nocardia rhizosphaerihabitans TaxID=1691570 RepID=UPI003671DF24
MRFTAALSVATAVMMSAFVVSCAPPPVRFPGAALESDLNQLVRDGGVPGAQLVATDGDHEIQLDGGFGDLTTETPFPDAARVRIASNTKTFVAAVVMQLVSEGRAALDVAVEHYLPGVITGPGGDGNRITVRQLLSHTSGIPDYLPLLRLSSEADLRRSRPVDELIAMALARPAMFEPGTEFRYSNTNYLLLGQVVERITGASIADEVTGRVIRPLGLTETYWPNYPAEQAIREPHPRAYHYFDDERVDVTDIDPNWGLPDGAMVSSGRDLNRFFTALVSGRLVPAAEFAEMTKTIAVHLPGITGVGLGLFRRTTSCGLEVWGHNGAIYGFSVLVAATATSAVTISFNQMPRLAEAARFEPAVLVDKALCALNDQPTPSRR